MDGSADEQKARVDPICVSPTSCVALFPGVADLVVFRPRGAGVLLPAQGPRLPDNEAPREGSQEVKDLLNILSKLPGPFVSEMRSPWTFLFLEPIGHHL